MKDSVCFMHSASSDHLLWQATHYLNLCYLLCGWPYDYCFFVISNTVAKMLRVTLQSAMNVSVKMQSTKICRLMKLDLMYILSQLQRVMYWYIQHTRNVDYWLQSLHTAEGYQTQEFSSSFSLLTSALEAIWTVVTQCDFCTFELKCFTDSNVLFKSEIILQ